MGDLGGYILILAAIVAGAFFSGSETGLVSVSRIRLRSRARAGHPGARQLQVILESQERALSAVLIGTNVTVVLGSAVATSIAERHMGARGPALATVVMTVLMLLFSELVPKAYFRARADTVMPSVAGLLRAAMIVLKPLVDLTSIFTGLLFLVFKREGRAPFLTRDEVRVIVRESGREGLLRASQRQMLEGVMGLGSTVVREVMIPLPEVVSISEDATVGELKVLLGARGHTRYPVYRKRVDHIVGLLNVFDVLFSKEEIPPDAPIRPFVRSIPVIPETKRIDVLLFELQRSRVTMGVIVNEFGACVGVVTVEDIVEEIVGEITDEHERTPVKIRRLSDGTYLLDAKTDIDDLNEELDMRLPKERYDTVGGLILKRLGRIPDVGDKVTVGDVLFEVAAVHKFGIRSVKAVLLGRGHDTHGGNQDDA